MQAATGSQQAWRSVFPSRALLQRLPPRLRLTCPSLPHTMPPQEAVEGRTGQAFNSCLLNYYRTGSDSLNWHSDNERLYGPQPTIGAWGQAGARERSVPGLWRGEGGCLTWRWRRPAYSLPVGTHPLRAHRHSLRQSCKVLGSLV